MSRVLRRGSIVMVALDPVVGSEAGKTRPAVVVANNTAVASAVRHEGTVTVVPLTSRTSSVAGFQALVPADDTGLPRDSMAQAEQIRTVSVRRIAGVVGWVPGGVMGRVDEALRIHLAL